MKEFRIYYPWPDFPSLSMSGNGCILKCDHCLGKYLSYMQNASMPEKLLSLAEKFYSEGKKGYLLSGGCDLDGKMLNLNKILPAVKKTIDEYDFIVKLHTGFLNYKDAENIVSSGVQIASMEMLSSSESIERVYHLSASAKDYLNTFLNLEKAGMPYITPHIVIGLPYSNRSEFQSIDFLKDLKISTLSLVVFRPTKGTIFEKTPLIMPEYFSEVAHHARSSFSGKIILAALRPRESEWWSKKDIVSRIEIEAIDNGLDGIEVPGKTALEYIRNNFHVRRIRSFGVLPVEMEGAVNFEVTKQTEKSRSL